METVVDMETRLLDRVTMNQMFDFQMRVGDLEDNNDNNNKGVVGNKIQ